MSSQNPVVFMLRIADNIASTNTLLALSVISTLVCSQASLAQEARPQVRTDVPADSLCLAKPIGSGVDKGKDFVIAVAPDAAAPLLERGFVEANCTQPRGVGAKPQTASPVEPVFCELVRARDPSANAGLWFRFSLTPFEGCNLRGSNLISLGSAKPVIERAQ